MTTKRSLIKLKRSILFLLLIFAAIQPLNSSSKIRIVAVGDIHGAYDAFVGILREAQLLNSDHQWTGTNTILVQTGDFLDRGPDSRKVMDLLMTLEKQAPKQKAKVIPLLGNHEVMNIIGDLRYVSMEEYASYSDSNSAKRLEEAYQAYQTFLKQRAKVLGKEEPAFTKESEEEWKKEHPPGFIEHRQAFSKDGKYGKWVRNLNGVAEIEKTIFLHGGISPVVSELSIEAMNRKIKNEIHTFDQCKQLLKKQKAALDFFTLDEFLEAAQIELELLKLKSEGESETSKRLQECLGVSSWLIIHPDGPLWFRGYSTWSDAEGIENVQNLLDKYKVSRFVSSHTVQQEGTIRSRFDGKIILIDTGMLSAYYSGGRASALEMNDGKITAIYPGKREPLTGN